MGVGGRVCLMGISAGCLSAWVSVPLTPTLPHFFLPSLVEHERDTGLARSRRQPMATPPLFFFLGSHGCGRVLQHKGKEDLTCIIDSL